MASLGKMDTQIPQPIQRFKSTAAGFFAETCTAPTWQRFSQTPHPSQMFMSTTAWKFDAQKSNGLGSLRLMRYIPQQHPQHEQMDSAISVLEG